MTGGLFPMVFCTACAQQQEDPQKFCRFCGERLPGATLVQQLRDEAANIKAQKTGQVTPIQASNNGKERDPKKFQTTYIYDHTGLDT